MNEHLMSAVLWAAVFFDTSSDDECDADLAVKQLEQIAYALRRLSPSEQDEFRRFARREAQRDPQMASRIAEVADALLRTS